MKDMIFKIQGSVHERNTVKYNHDMVISYIISCQANHTSCIVTFSSPSMARWEHILWESVVCYLGQDMP